MAHQTKELLENFVRGINNKDVEGLLDLIHDDYTEIFPQSGEKIRGKEKFQKFYENFSNLPKVKGYNVQLEGNIGVLEMLLDYPDGGTVNACEIIEFRDGKIASVKAYFAQPFEAPEWRSEWVEMIGEPTSEENYDTRPSPRA